MCYFNETSTTIVLFILLNTSLPCLVWFGFNQKKRTCHLVDFSIPADLRMKIKESSQINKFLDLAKELTTVWNMKVTEIPIVFGVLGMVSKALENNLEELKPSRLLLS